MALENNEIVLESLWQSLHISFFVFSLRDPITQAYNHLTTQYWRPSDEFQKSFAYTSKEDYVQFPCVSCSYCSRLLYPHSVKIGNPKQ